MIHVILAAGPLVHAAEHPETALADQLHLTRPGQPVIIATTLSGPIPFSYDMHSDGPIKLADDTGRTWKIRASG